MQTVIIVIHLMLVVSMIAVVLLQRSEGGGLGMGSSSGFMTSRGTANLLTRTTAILAGGFFLTSLALSWMAGYDRRPASIVAPTSTSAPVSPGSPLSGAPSGGIRDLLNQADKAAQPAAPAPSGPAAPQSQ
jgi:preprotein translocase subunit SecG